MVKLFRQTGSTLRQGHAAVELRSRLEVQGRRRRGTVTWGAAGVCVDVPGSTPNERRAVAFAVVEQFISEVQ